MKIPEGWPTDEMLFAAREACDDMFQTDFIRAFNAALAAAPTPPACPMCNGRGEIGGFVNADSGYQNDPCLECAPTPPAQSHHELDDADIRAIALDCGFKLKPQPDGSEDLNLYVYKFARELISSIPRIKDVAALLERLKPPAQEDELAYEESEREWCLSLDDPANDGLRKAAEDDYFETRKDDYIEMLEAANKQLKSSAEEVVFGYFEGISSDTKIPFEVLMCNLRTALEEK